MMQARCRAGLPAGDDSFGADAGVDIESTRAVELDRHRPLRGQCATTDLSPLAGINPL